MKTTTALLIACLAAALSAAAWSCRPCRQAIADALALLSDKDRLQVFLSGLGMAAPVVFVLLQIAQVIVAPFPGEISGLIGGYLFGAIKGFLLSSIGLTTGSYINFAIGRFMGARYIRKRIPPEKRRRLDALLKRQGLMVVFLLFIFPGFPKDYLCLFLGLSDIPIKVFLLMATIGRMPGTLMLSLQGAALFDEMYGVFAAITAVCLVMVFFAYRFRERLYRWAAGPDEKP